MPGWAWRRRPPAISCGWPTVPSKNSERAGNSRLARPKHGHKCARDGRTGAGFWGNLPPMRRWEEFMRLARFIPALLVLFLAVPVLAQTGGWIEYTDRQEMFRIN